MNFALIGCGGYIAPKHLRAIKETGNTLVAACDPCDSVGILDSYNKSCRFFKETEDLGRYLNEVKNTPDRVDWVSICSPNYMHTTHSWMALSAGCNVICEKPVVLHPWQFSDISALEKETGKRVYTVLQLRLQPTVLYLKNELLPSLSTSVKHKVDLIYSTPRGPWYDVSWKGDERKSGGVLMNIGVHLFDMLIFLFGPVVSCELGRRASGIAKGNLEFETASVNWVLSIDSLTLPKRSLTIDGQEYDFTGGFTDLHTEVYRNTLAGKGFAAEDSRKSIELISDLLLSRLRENKTTEPRENNSQFKITLQG